MRKLRFKTNGYNLIRWVLLVLLASLAHVMRSSFPRRCGSWQGHGPLGSDSIGAIRLSTNAPYLGCHLFGHVSSIAMIGLVLLPCAFFMTGCEDKKQEKPPEYSWFHPPSEAYPEGSVEVLQGKTRFLMPRSAVGHVSSGGSITIGMIWPEFESLKSVKNLKNPWGRGDGVQVTIDTIDIFFNSPVNDTAEAYKQRRRQAIDAFTPEMELSTEFPDFYEYRDERSNPKWYMPVDKTEVDPQGLPLTFHCSTSNLEVDWNKTEAITANLPQCGIFVKWPDGHELNLRFYRKHMRDAIDIYKKVIALHDSFVVNAEAAQNTNNTP